ncbi:MAG: hypothetical protein M3032_01675 [Verrucomicrobiota bacterium]|nr:hypothetical protein [Verrucomicrobiota bacterium]
MRRKPIGLIAVALLLALGIWVARRTDRIGPKKEIPPLVITASASPNESSQITQPPLSAAPVSPNERSSTPGSPAQPGSVARATPAPIPPDAEAMIEVDKVNLMIRDFRTIAGENPVGTNAEIMAAVMGNNPRQAKLGPPEGMKLNEKGELLDRWGTPYFFHQLSRDHMEIRSAGPDKVLWTGDDPVIR